MQALYNEESSEAVQAPVSAQEKAKAIKRINKMRRSLRKWVKKRKINDDAAMGKRPAKVPAHVLAKTLPLARDWKLEQRLAIQIHGLLSSFMDSAQLPDPDISKDPNAAVALAQIAISGNVPGEAQSKTAQGFIPVLFIWPLVAVVGMVMLTIMSKIGSDADLAAQKEENRCIGSGACTDSGFWMKFGAIAVVGWIAWDKLGVKKAFNK